MEGGPNTVSFAAFKHMKEGRRPPEINVELAASAEMADIAGKLDEQDTKFWDTLDADTQSKVIANLKQAAELTKQFDITTENFESQENALQIAETSAKGMFEAGRLKDQMIGLLCPDRSDKEQYVAAQNLVKNVFDTLLNVQ